MNEKSIAFIGLGNMGTALATMIAQNGYNVLGWEHNKEVVQQINSIHENAEYLPNVKLNKNLKATHDIKAVLKGHRLIFVALPVKFFHQTLQPHSDLFDSDAILVNLSKGVDEESFFTGTGLLKSMLRTDVISLSGPSIAEEFVHNSPCGVMLAGHNLQSLLDIAEVLDTDSFRTCLSNDLTGVEWSGILKNIYAIAIGLIEGSTSFERTNNFLGLILTHAMQEMRLTVKALGGNSETVDSLAGIGDLVTTSVSSNSHHHECGKLLAQGLSLDDIKEKLGIVPEGVRTLRVLLSLAEKHHLKLPLAHNLMKVINGECSTNDFNNNYWRNYLEL